MAHRRRQQFAQRRKVTGNEAVRIISRQAPILAGGVQHVRRRADRYVPQQAPLLGPAVRSGGVDADGEVDVKTDGAAALTSDRLTRRKLTISHPLNVLMKADLIGPLPPAGVELRSQCLECGKAFETPTTFAPERGKVVATIRPLAKPAVTLAQRPHLGARDARIVDQ